MSERIVMVGDLSAEEQRIAEAVGVEVVSEEQADALRRLALAPKVEVVEPTRAERFMQRQINRVRARRATENASRLARELTDAHIAKRVEPLRIAAAQAKRARKAAKRLAADTEERDT